jgi:hypothetical protein
LAATIVTCATLIVGCRPAGAPDLVDKLVVRDSLGVVVVDNPGSAARIELGEMVANSEMLEFDSPPVSGVAAARILDGGRVVLTNDEAKNLLFLEPENGRVISVGRAGAGPEEFANFHDLLRCAGDTVVVRIGAAGLRVLDGHGAFIQSKQKATLRGPTFGITSDCTEVVVNAARGRVSDPVSELVVAWFNLTSDVVREVTRLPLQERQVINFLGSPVPVIVPFAPAASVVVARDHVVLGFGDTPELRWYDRSGNLRRVVRWHAERKPLSRPVREDYERLRLALDSLFRAGTTAQTPSLSEFRLPKAIPLFAGILADDKGRIWLRQYPPLWDGYERLDPSLNTFSNNWWLFSETGELLGTVTTPARFVVKDIRAGHVLGLRVGETGLVRVTTAPLRSSLVDAAPAKR